MKKIQSVFFLIFLILLLFAFNRPLDPSKNSFMKEQVKLTLQGDPPLNINGNYLLSYIASEGNGTLVDPYIIANKIIMGGSSDCISIQNTNAHFILKNCTLGDSNLAGIYLHNVTNGRICNNTITKNNYGIYCWESFQNWICNNTIMNNSYGIVLKEVCQIWIYNNTYINHIVGIWLRPPIDNNSINSNNSIRNNKFINYKHGILIEHSSNISITNNELYNEFSDNLYGIHMVDNSLYCNIFSNYLVGNEYGIQLDNSYYNQIFNNTVTSNNEGIALLYANYNFIINNSINFNSNIGISFYSSNNNVISNNTIYNNINVGIIFIKSSNNTIFKNILIFNKIGIQLSEISNLNTILINNISSEEYNIYLEDSDFNQIKGNWFYCHSSPPIYEGSCTGNIFENNEFQDCPSDIPAFTWIFGGLSLTLICLFSFFYEHICTWAYRKRNKNMYREMRHNCIL